MMKCQQKDCESKFVAWKWLVGIIIAGVAAISSMAYAYGVKETMQDSKLTDHDLRIVAVERIHSDLDTVKMLLRNRN